MKRLINYELISMIWVGLIFCTSLIGGCQKGEPDGETMWMPLSKIPENPVYRSLPLTGIQWKLIGFANQRTNAIKLAESARENSYTLLFEEDGYISGHTSTNIASGKFETNNSTIFIAVFGTNTFVNEWYDGEPFIDAMKKVSTFEMSSRGLMLHYEEDKFLLFKPIE